MSYKFDNKEMGRRLSIARRIAGKELGESGKIIGISEQELSYVEDGSIALGMDEIISLAKFYDTSSSRLVCYDTIHTDLVPRFRKHANAEDIHTLESAKLLNLLFTAEAELENLLGIEHVPNFPKSFDIGKGEIKKLAIEHAELLREFLKLGHGPIDDIFSVIEKKLGIRLYQCKLEEKSKVWGIYAFDERLGACILLNAKYSQPWRVLTAAHELGHFMGNREKIAVDDENNRSNAREERYARNFSYAFTMPERSFREAFFKMSNNSNELTNQLVIRLADKFHVTRYACVRQLEEYGLVKGARKWYESTGKLNEVEKKELLGTVRYQRRYAHCDDADRIIPHHIGVMAHKAWKSALLSEGQLSSMLNLGRIELRKVLLEIEIGGPI